MYNQNQFELQLQSQFSTQSNPKWGKSVRTFYKPFNKRSQITLRMHMFFIAS